MVCADTLAIVTPNFSLDTVVPTPVTTIVSSWSTSTANLKLCVRVPGFRMTFSVREV
jgi:hypothetical protein